MSQGEQKPDVQGWKKDAMYLALLLVLVLPLRGWLLFNTEVMARDSIGYIRYALELERTGWRETLLKHHQHPGYATLILAVSLPVRAWLGEEPNSFNMQLSAQLATSLAALLLLLPMYFSGKLLFDQSIAFWGTLFFQTMPISGHHLADGISEGLFLLLTCTSLFFGLLAIRRQSAHCFAWCGFWAGLAYVTRPEGALLLIAAGLVLAARQFSPRMRLSWRRLALMVLSLMLPALATGSVYYGVTNTFTRKPSVDLIFQGETQVFVPEKNIGVAGALWAVCFADFLSSHTLSEGITVFALELTQIFHYWGIGAVMLGMAWHGRRLLRRSEFWLVLFYLGLQSLVVLALAVKAGYISDRHLMPLALWGSFFAAAGLRELPMHCDRWLFHGAASRQPNFWKSPAAGALIMPLMFIVTCLPSVLQRLHGNRAGNHTAGIWLADKLRLGDEVDDDHCWTHYYSGRMFREHIRPVLSSKANPQTFVVITRSRDKEIAKVRNEVEAKLRGEDAKVVYVWPEHVGEDKARVVVYQMPRSFQRNPWDKSSD